MIYITDKRLPLAAGTYTITEIDLSELWVWTKGKESTIVFSDAYMAKQISSYLIYPPVQQYKGIRYISDGDEVFFFDTEGEDVAIYRCVFKADTSKWATEPREVTQ